MQRKNNDVISHKRLCLYICVFDFSGGGKDREQRPHQSEGGGTGRVSGPV